VFRFESFKTVRTIRRIIGVTVGPRNRTADLLLFGARWKRRYDIRKPSNLYVGPDSCDEPARGSSTLSDQSEVRLEPWGTGDLPLLVKLLGDPEMTKHIGGPESPEKLAERQTRYERMDPAAGRMLKIVASSTGEEVGWVGYWERTWRDEGIYEIGWSVLPSHQGRGIATRATSQAIERARSDGRHRFVHAFPSVNNGPSNAICRKLGFTLIEERDFEYPPGNFLRCNDWRLDLFAGGRGRPTAGKEDPSRHRASP
jgi:RimJ/RimL family protein N-acetyltransferase